MCLLALLHRASYPILVHRLTGSFHASYPRSVALTQLHFLSFAVVSSREDFHLQDRAHAGRTHPPRPKGRRFLQPDGNVLPRVCSLRRLRRGHEGFRTHNKSILLFAGLLYLSDC